MIRILLMTTRMDDGGAERYLFEHLSHMNKKNMSFDYYLLYSVESQEMKRKYENMGVRIFERHLIENGGKGCIQYLKDMECFYNEQEKYDVIHVNGMVPILQMCAMYIAKKNNIKIRIVHSHSAPPNKVNMASLFNLMAKQGTNRYATNLFACSKKAGISKYGKRGVVSSKFRIMKNGIDTEKFRFSDERRREVRKQHGWVNKFIIMNVGRLSKEKNQVFLLDLCTEMTKEVDNIKFIFVGEGDERSCLEEIVMKKGISQYVEFMGNRTDVNDLLQGADVFCLPSFFEGFPFVGLEAQCEGLRCIVSNNVPKAIDCTGIISFLPIDNNSDDWVSAILECDTKFRIDYSELVKEKGYDIRDTASELKKIYEG